MRKILMILICLIARTVIAQDIKGEWIEEYQFISKCQYDTLYYSDYYKNNNRLVENRFKPKVARYLRVDSDSITINTPFYFEQLIYRKPYLNKSDWNVQKIKYKIQNDSLFSDSYINNYRKIYQDSNMIIWCEVHSWEFDIWIKVWTKQNKKNVELDDYFIVPFLKKILEHCSSNKQFIDNRKYEEIKKEIELENFYWNRK